MDLLKKVITYKNIHVEINNLDQILLLLTQSEDYTTLEEKEVSRVKDFISFLSLFHGILPYCKSQCSLLIFHAYPKQCQVYNSSFSLHVLSSTSLTSHPWIIYVQNTLKFQFCHMTTILWAPRKKQCWRNSWQLIFVVVICLFGFLFFKISVNLQNFKLHGRLQKILKYSRFSRAHLSQKSPLTYLI